MGCEPTIKKNHASLAMLNATFSLNFKHCVDIKRHRRVEDMEGFASAANTKVYRVKSEILGFSGSKESSFAFQLSCGVPSRLRVRGRGGARFSV